MDTFDTLITTPRNRAPAEWMPWSMFYPRYPQFFATREQSSHFIQTRKEKMYGLGVLIDAPRGYLVHERKLEGLLLGLLAKNGADLPVATTGDTLAELSDDDLRAELERREAEKAAGTK